MKAKMLAFQHKETGVYFAVTLREGEEKKMADFCRDCSIAIWGKDFRDMAQLMPQEGYSNEPGNEAGALVLCECCGPIIVDINGRRLDGQEFHKECHCRELIGHFEAREVKEVKA